MKKILFTIFITITTILANQEFDFEYNQFKKWYSTKEHKPDFLIK